jgi:pyrroline-5-carboxylate reductase
MKIVFIGGGNMGEVIISAILERGLSTPDSIQVSDIKAERRQYLKQTYGIASDNRMVAAGGEVVVLAVKPQNLTEVMAELNGRLKSDQLVLSIIAGAKIDTLRRGLSHNAVVRAMPNTPAKVGQGVSVWTATAEVTAQQKANAASILGALGGEFYVADEKYLDMATAVSGSGPAYVFLFVEALVEAAVKIGLPQDMAAELVMQTLLGSGGYLQKSGRAPAELRQMVTSPGGTTAEALARFEEGGFKELVLAAVVAAYEKAKKLGS